MNTHMQTLTDVAAARAAIAEVLRHPDDVPEALLFAFEERETVEVPSHLTRSGRPELVTRDEAWLVESES